MRISFNTAIDLLNSGHVVAIPTETVYGLAASLAYPKAMEAVFSLKGRPAQNPLILHLAEVAQLNEFISETVPYLQELSTAFWPGPLTLVLSVITSTIPVIATAGLPTAAFRIPGHSTTRQILRMTGPLVMPSANLSGRPSATTPEHVEDDFGKDFPVLDGGPTRCGVESTVLKECSGKWQIIRTGALPPSTFESILGYIPVVVTAKVGEMAVCPGQLYRHYAPRARLIPTKLFTEEMQGFVVGYSDRRYPADCVLFELGPSHTPERVAENLYATLRRLDDKGVEQAWVDIQVPNQGLWITIAERLQKASDR